MASPPTPTAAFAPPTFWTSRPPLAAARLPRRSHPPIISAASPPKRIGAVAKDLQQALQSSLQARTSRIALCLPTGAKLGTEKRGSDEDAVARRVAGDRELARLVAGMFAGTGLSVRVVFAGVRERSRAAKVWGPGVEYRVEDWGKGGGKVKRKGKTGGFREMKEEEMEVEDVHVMVGGGAAFAERVRRFAKEVGMDRLVIVVNGNSEGDKLPVDLETFWDKEFESVYHYQPNPHPKWSGGVLFRKFPDDWVLCRLSGLRMLQQLLVSKEKPSLEQVGNALSDEEQKPSLLNKISTFIDGNAP